MPLLNRWANRAFARLLTTVLGVDLSDTLCGTKAFFRKDFLSLGIPYQVEGRALDPFGDFELLFNAVERGLQFAEVPVWYKARRHGQTKIARWRHGLQLVCFIWARWQRGTARLVHTSSQSRQPAI